MEEQDRRIAADRAHMRKEAEEEEEAERKKSKEQRDREAAEEEEREKSESAKRAAFEKREKEITREIYAQVKSGFRESARKNHPDHGGSTEKMIVVNTAHQRLLELVKEHYSE